MFDLAVLLFGAATLIALALSVWVPPHLALGRPFWALTTLVLLLPLAIIALLMVLSTREYAVPIFMALLMVLKGEYTVPILLLFVWIPVAAGWLLGLVLAVVVRFFRSRRSQVP